MTIMGAARDRCRLCFSLIGRERSICCQKYYHLFKPIERERFSNRKLTSYSIPIRNRTVCFHDLLRRYLRTSINPLRNSSNLICAGCSMILLDIEQCAKYLRKTINQLKMKLNRSRRLQTSSLSATFQKKFHPEQKLTGPQEQFPHSSDSESDDQFDAFDDDEESDEEHDQSKENASNSNHWSSSSSKVHSIVADHSNGECNDPEIDEDEDEDGLIKQPKAHQEHNSNLFELQLAQMIGSSNPGVPNHVDSTMNTFAHMQRNILFQFLNDPLAAAQAAAAAAAAMSVSPVKAALASMPLINSKVNASHASTKQIGSSRKRKSTPEKRVITNHRTSTNNGELSPKAEPNPLEAISTLKGTDAFDYPLELTLKAHSRSNQSPIKSTSQVQNLVMNSLVENSSGLFNHASTPNEDRIECGPMNDSALSLSPSLIRRPTAQKRVKLSNSSQFDATKIISSQTTDLLSPNLHDDAHLMNSSKQSRKLDPRSCAECGKILFSDKTHLLHCQTHAKNDKECWICGAHDDDIKKHILTEHANQKFTADGFKCQHCERVFPIYSDLQSHMREHTKKKPFECSICHKRFGQQGNLSCHLRIHSGVKPFSCSNCGKAFRHSNSLRRHARTVHSASRNLTMSPGSMATSTTPSSLLLSTAATSNSMVTMANDIHRLSTNDAYEDGPSGLLIASDEGESLQGLGSPSTGDAPSPTMSNAPVDSDSPETI